MATFTDDFNRPDGPVGNGWTVVGNGIGISGGEVVTTQFGNIWRDDVIGEGYQDVALDAIKTSTTGSTAWVYAKLDIVNRNGYSFNLQATGANSYAQLWRLVNGGQQSLGQTLIPVPVQGTHRLRVVYSAGVISCYCDGNLVHSANDNTWDSLHGYGFRLGGSTAKVDNFAATDTAATAFDAEPEPIVQMAVEQALTLTGTGTSWTPGTPGAPTFTVDKGTLANQSVQSPTQATADYTPPQADDVARFTDPSTGNFDDVPLSTGFQVEPAPPCPWTAEQVGTNELGESVFGDFQTLLARTKSPVVGQTPTTLFDYLGQITLGLSWGDLGITFGQTIETHGGATTDLWDVLSAILGLAGSNLATEQDTNILLRNWTANDTMTVFDLIASLKGLGVYDNTQVANLIRGISNNEQYSLLSVLQWISALRGENNIDLTQLYSLISTIAPPDLSPILDYLDWITAFKSTSLPPIKTAADTAVTRINATYDALAVDYEDLKARLIDLKTDVDAWFNHLHGDMLSYFNQLWVAITNGDSQTQQLVNLANSRLLALTTKTDNLQTDVTYIKNHLSTAGFGPPVWPGLANVTIGQQKPLSVGLTLDGPLNGVIIDVTSGGSHGPPFQFDGDLSYQKIGAITFQTDTGKNEFPQLLGFGHAIYAPKTMRSAAHAKVRCAADITGTATAWALTT